jgi:DNA-binding transcriptional LysR family regulator
MADRKRTELDWQDVRMFLALGRYRSLSATARALQINHATVSRRIKALESSVGEKLVERRPDGYLLTGAGDRALKVAAEMEAAAQSLVRPGQCEEDALRGMVRINAPPALAHGFLIGRLVELTVLHTGLDVDLATDVRSVSLSRHEADLAVRVGRPVDIELVGKSLGRMAFGFYATEAHRAQAQGGMPPTFIGFNEQNADISGSKWLAKHFPASRTAVRLENHIQQALAAQAGAGVALLPHYLGRQYQNLVCLALQPLPPAREMWLLFRSEDRESPNVRAVAQHLISSFKQDESLFSA